MAAVHEHQRANLLGEGTGEANSDRAAPGMAHERHGFEVESRDQPPRELDQVVDAVSLRCQERARSEAGAVDRDDAPAGLDEPRCELGDQSP